jgi:hypothetical protein
VVGFALPHDEASLAQAIDGLLAACGLPHLPPGDLRPSRGLTSRSAQRLALTTFWDQ